MYISQDPPRNSLVENSEMMLRIRIDAFLKQWRELNRAIRIVSNYSEGSSEQLAHLSISSHYKKEVMVQKFPKYLQKETLSVNTTCTAIIIVQICVNLARTFYVGWRCNVREKASSLLCHLT